VLADRKGAEHDLLLPEHNAVHQKCESTRPISAVADVRSLGRQAFPIEVVCVCTRISPLAVIRGAKPEFVIKGRVLWLRDARAAVALEDAVRVVD
jgi:hypothetical protein